MVHGRDARSDGLTRAWAATRAACFPAQSQRSTGGGWGIPAGLAGGNAPVPGFGISTTAPGPAYRSRALSRQATNAGAGPLDSFLGFRVDQDDHDRCHELGRLEPVKPSLVRR